MSWPIAYIVRISIVLNPMILSAKLKNGSKQRRTATYLPKKQSNVLSSQTLSEVVRNTCIITFLLLDLTQDKANIFWSIRHVQMWLKNSVLLLHSGRSVYRENNTCLKMVGTLLSLWHVASLSLGTPVFTTGLISRCLVLLQRLYLLPPSDIKHYFLKHPLTMLELTLGTNTWKILVYKEAYLFYV